MDDVVYLRYVDTPDWHGAISESDWRQFISAELRTIWPTFTYEQKWAIAQNAGDIGHGLAVLMPTNDLKARGLRPRWQRRVIPAPGRP